MIDVNDFLQRYYDINEQKMLTVEDFEKLKQEKGIEEWDYPLEEYEHLAENGIKAVPVRFWNPFGIYDYRFCEVGRSAKCKT